MDLEQLMQEVQETHQLQCQEILEEVVVTEEMDLQLEAVEEQEVIENLILFQYLDLIQLLL